jgi:hypothetical protein
MIARLGFVPLGTAADIDRPLEDAMNKLAYQCRSVAEAHMALAETAEGLTEQFLDNRRLRASLRTLARYHRRSAWQNLEMA